MELKKLTDEKFKEIYTCERFRNEVAFAHQCADKNGVFKYYSTTSHPNRFIVTPEQIEEAKSLRAKRKQEVLKENVNKLLFVGMGTTYEPRYEDDVCNFRVRTLFLNKYGKEFFIEFGTLNNSTGLHINHAIDIILEKKMKEKASFYRNKIEEEKEREHPNQENIRSYRKLVNANMEQPYNNYKGLEMADLNLKYTKSNLLKVVNEYFDCNFKEVVIDNYNISHDGTLHCKSPRL